MGSLIVIEGLDGSGKATQTARLARRLSAGGRGVRTVSFPNYQSAASAPVEMYLSGAFGKDPQSVNAYAASSFYAIDRYASFKLDWQAAYGGQEVILADRYTTSNAIHQCAKLEEEEWEAYIAWLEDFEYLRLGIPRPDMVLYLDVPPAVSQELLAQRYGGAGAGDIHERDVEYLMCCRRAAHWCARRFGWKTVNCAPAGSLRAMEDITGELEELVRREGI